MVKSPKKKGDLPPKLKEVFELIKVNPTTNYVIKKTGYDKRNVSKLLNRLIRRGYIRRMERGFYKVLKSPNLGKVVTVDREISDYFRYHNLQIKVNLNQSDLRKLRNKLIKLETHKEEKNGIFFKYIHTGLVSKDAFYLYFSKNWDIISESYDDLMDKVYEEIMNNLSKWNQRFNIGIFKDNKINFAIHNQHIALVKNGIVKEFKNNKISEFVVYDNNDGKARFLMDFSKGLAELEAVHPLKANEDVQEAKYFMNTLKEGRYRNMYESYSNFFDVPDKVRISDLNKKMNSILEILETLTNKQIKTDSQLSSLTSITEVNVKLLQAELKKKEILNYSNKKIDYVS